MAFKPYCYECESWHWPDEDHKRDPKQEPHAYMPSTMYMGDCTICGLRPGDAIHSPFRRKG